VCVCVCVCVNQAHTSTNRETKISEPTDWFIISGTLFKKN